MVNLFTIENGQLVSPYFDNQKTYPTREKQIQELRRTSFQDANLVPISFKTQVKLGSNPDEQFEIFKNRPKFNQNVPRKPVSNVFQYQSSFREPTQNLEPIYYSSNQNIGSGRKNVAYFENQGQFDAQKTFIRKTPMISISKDTNKNKETINEYRQRIIQELHDDSPVSIDMPTIISSSPDNNFIPIRSNNPEVDVFTPVISVGGDSPPTGPITKLVLKPVARATAGANGTAIARPVSHAVVQEGENVDIDFDPQATAVVGPGGTATAYSDLIISIVKGPKTIEQPSEVGLEYYGGARGMVLTYHPVLGLTPSASIKKEEEEDVGQETEPPQQKPPPSSPGDSITISKPPAGASVAEARPVGLAIAGVGGTASAQPTGTAVVGPAGLAISRPVATAIAGVQLGEQVLSGITGSKPQISSDDTQVNSASNTDPQTYTSGTNPSPVVVAVAPGALQNLYYHVIPSQDQGQAEGKSNDLRGVLYGQHRPDDELVTEKPSSPYQKPTGNRGPMYGYVPTADHSKGSDVLRFSQNPFFTHGVQYAYPDLPIDFKQSNYAYNAMSGTEKDRELNLAVGPNGGNGKYSIIPLSKAGVQDNKQPISSSYQFMTGGKPAVGFNQVVYPITYY